MLTTESIVQNKCESLMPLSDANNISLLDVIKLPIKIQGGGQYRRSIIFKLLMQGTNPDLVDSQGDNAFDYLEKYLHDDPTEKAYLQEAFEITRQNIKSALVLQSIKEAQKNTVSKDAQIKKRPLLILGTNMDNSAICLIAKNSDLLTKNGYTTLCIEAEEPYNEVGPLKEEKESLELLTPLFKQLYEDWLNALNVGVLFDYQKANDLIMSYRAITQAKYRNQIIVNQAFNIEFIDPPSEKTMYVDDNEVFELISKLRDIGMFNAIAISALKKEGAIVAIIGASHGPGICKLFNEYFQDLPDIQPIVIFPYNTELSYDYLKHIYLCLSKSLMNEMSEISFTHPCYVLPMSLLKRQASLETFSSLLFNEIPYALVDKKNVCDNLHALTTILPIFELKASIKVIMNDYQIRWKECFMFEQDSQIPIQVSKYCKALTVFKNDVVENRRLIELHSSKTCKASYKFFFEIRQINAVLATEPISVFKALYKGVELKSFFQQLEQFFPELREPQKTLIFLGAARPSTNLSTTPKSKNRCLHESLGSNVDSNKSNSKTLMPLPRDRGGKM